MSKVLRFPSRLERDWPIIDEVITDRAIDRGLSDAGVKRVQHRIRSFYGTAADLLNFSRVTGPILPEGLAMNLSERLDAAVRRLLVERAAAEIQTALDLGLTKVSK